MCTSIHSCSNCSRIRYFNITLANWRSILVRTPGKAQEFELPHAAPLAELLAAIIAGGKVTLCTQCAVRRGINEKDLIDGIKIAGAASFLAEIIEPDIQALVY